MNELIIEFTLGDLNIVDVNEKEKGDTNATKTKKTY